MPLVVPKSVQKRVGNLLEICMLFSRVLEGPGGAPDGRGCTSGVLTWRRLGPGGRLQRGVLNKGYRNLWTILQ